MPIATPTYLVSQVAFVVGDLEQTMRDYHETLGWGPWSVYEYREPWLRDLKADGQPANFTWLGAETRVGSIWIELLQPLEGTSPFTDWHNHHGDGVHHVGYEVSTMEEATQLYRSFNNAGASEVISAWCGDIYFYYMSTKPIISEVWVGSADDLEPLRVFPHMASERKL
jgi:methylmalonyl-CoA/ethylmalonyl-CoA epimerase